MTPLNELDKNIIKLLHENGRRPVSEISEELGEPATTIRGRLKRLEQSGVITGYIPLIDPKQLGYDIQAIVLIRRDSGGHLNDILPFIETLPGIVQFQNPLGDVDGLLTVWAKNIDGLSAVIRKINKIEGVIRTETLVILEQKRFLPPSKLFD